MVHVIIEMHWVEAPEVYENIRRHLKAGEFRPDKEEYADSFAYFLYCTVFERIYDFPL